MGFHYQITWSPQKAYSCHGCSFWHGVFAFKKYRPFWSEMWQSASQSEGSTTTHMQGNCKPCILSIHARVHIDATLSVSTACWIVLIILRCMLQFNFLPRRNMIWMIWSPRKHLEHGPYTELLRFPNLLEREMIFIMESLPGETEQFTNAEW